jgi:hypothetical protein
MRRLASSTAHRQECLFSEARPLGLGVVTADRDGLQASKEAVSR